MKKKILSIFLIILLVFGYVPNLINNGVIIGETMGDSLEDTTSASEPPLVKAEDNVEVDTLEEDTNPEENSKETPSKLESGTIILNENFKTDEVEKLDLSYNIEGTGKIIEDPAIWIVTDMGEKATLDNNQGGSFEVFNDYSKVPANVKKLIDSKYSNESKTILKFTPENSKYTKDQKNSFSHDLTWEQNSFYRYLADGTTLRNFHYEIIGSGSNFEPYTIKSGTYNIKEKEINENYITEEENNGGTIYFNDDNEELVLPVTSLLKVESEDQYHYSKIKEVKITAPNYVQELSYTNSQGENKISKGKMIKGVTTFIIKSSDVNVLGASFNIKISKVDRKDDSFVEGTSGFVATVTREHQYYDNNVMDKEIPVTYSVINIKELENNVPVVNVPLAPLNSNFSKVKAGDGPKAMSFQKVIANQNNTLFEPGTVVQYQLGYNNDTGTPLSSFVVVDNIDTNLTVVPGTLTVNGVLQSDAIDGDMGNTASNIVMINHGTLAEFDGAFVTFKVLIKESTPIGTNISNMATAVTATMPNMNSPVASFTVKAPAVQLSKEITAPTSINPGTGNPYFSKGGEIPFRLLIKNTQATELSDYMVMDNLNTSNLEFVSADITPTSTTGGIIKWNSLPPLAPGSSIEINLVAKPKGPTPTFGTFSNSFEVDKKSNSSVLGVSGQVPFDIIDVPPPVISKSVENSNGTLKYSRGDTVDYTIKVNKETGSYDLNSVAVTDQIPNTLTYVLGSLKLNGAPISDGNISLGGLLTVNINNLSSENTITYSAIVNELVAGGTTISNSAVATNIETGDIAEANASFKLENVRVNLYKVLNSTPPPSIVSNGVNYYRYGDLVSYAFMVSNNTSMKITDLVVKDVIGPEFEFVSVSPEFTYDPGTRTITNEIAQLNPLEAKYYVLNLRVNTKNSIMGIPNTITGEFTNGLDPNPSSFTNTNLNTLGDGELKVTKSVEPENATSAYAPGSKVKYTVDLENSDNGVILSDVNFNDFLLSNLTFVSGSLKLDGVPLSDGVDGDSGSLSSSEIKAQLGNMMSNEKHTLTFLALIPNSANPMDRYTNIGVGTFTNNVDEIVTVTDDAIFEVAGPDAQLTKTVISTAPYTDSSGNPYYKSGDEIQYRLKIENKGNGELKNYTVTDILPDDFTFVSSTPFAPSVVNGAGNPVWTGLNLNGGDSIFVDVTARVNPNSTGKYTNKFSLSNDYYTNPLEASVDVDVKNIEAPTVSKSYGDDNGGSVERGDVLTYTIDIENSGDVLDEVQFKDQLPENFTFVPGSIVVNGGNSTAGDSDVSASGFMSFLIKDVPATATVTYKVTVNNDAPGGSVNSNTVVIENTQTSDQSTATVDVTLGSVDIVLGKSVAPSTPPTVNNSHYKFGDTVRYNFTVKNNGTMQSGEVEVKDVIGNEFQFVSFQDPLDPNFVYNNGTKTFTYTIDSLDSLEEVSFYIDVVIVTKDSIENIPNTLSGKNINGTDLDPTAATDTSVSTIANGTLNATKKVEPVDSNNAYYPDSEVLYTIDIANIDSSGYLNNITLNDVIPSGLSAVAGSMKLDGVALTDGADGDAGTLTSGNVSLHLDTLDPNGVKVLTFKAKISSTATDKTVISNTANVSSTNYDGTVSTENPAVNFTVKAPILTLSKSVISTAPYIDSFGEPYYLPGDEITYRLRVENTGTGNVSGVNFQDDLNNNFTFISSSIPTTAMDPGGVLHWNNVTINAGTFYEVDVVVTAIDETRGVIGNKFSAAHNTYTFADSNNVNVLIKTILPPEIDKSVGADSDNNGFYNRGEVVTYTIKVNGATGSSTLDEINVTDALPSSLTYIPGSLKLNGTTLPDTLVDSNGLLTVNLVDVTGTEEVITFDCTINLDVPESTIIVNEATATNPKIGDTSTSSVSIALGSNDINLKKTVDGSTPPTVMSTYYKKDDVIRYDVTVTNNGTITVSNLEVSDVISDYYSYVNSSEGTYDALSKSWSAVVPSLIPGGTKTYTIDVKVITDESVSQLANIVTGKFTDNIDSDPVPGTNSDVSILNDSELIHTKTVSNNNPESGDIITYTIHVKNPSNAFTVSNVEVNDVLPAGLSAIPGTLKIDGVSDGTITGNTIYAYLGELNISSVQGSEHTVTFDARVDKFLSDGQIIENTSEVTFELVAGTQLTSTSTSELTIKASNVNLDKTLVSTPAYVDGTGNKYFPSEGEFVYRLKIENNGSGPLTGFDVYDKLNSNLVFVSMVTGPTPTIESGNVLHFSNVDLLGGEVKYVDIKVKSVPNYSGEILNSFTLESTDLENKLTSNEVKVNIRNVQGTVLSKEVSDDNLGRYERGDIVTYTINVSNVPGSDPMYDLTLDDVIPEFLTYVDNSLSIDGVSTDDTTAFDGTGLTLNLSNVDGTVTIEYQCEIDLDIPQGEIVTNTAVVVDNILLDEVTASAAFNMGSSNVTLNKKLLTTPPVSATYFQVNDELTYEISATNDAGATIKSDVLEVKDVLGAQFQYLDSQGGSYDPLSKTVTFTVDPLDQGASSTFWVKVKVVGTTPTRGVPNTVTGAFENGVDQNPIEFTNEEVNILGDGSLKVQKDVSPLSANGKYEAGSDVLYTVVIENQSSDGILKDVSFTDNLPTGITSISNTLTVNGVTVSDGVDGDSGSMTSTAVNVDIGDMNPRDKVTITFKGTIDSTLRDQSRVTNVGNVSYKKLDGSTVSDSDSAEFIAQAPNLVLTKSLLTPYPYHDGSGVGYFKSGDEFTYRLNVANTGTSNLVQGNLVDQLSTNLTYLSSTPVNPNSVAGNTLRYTGINIDSNQSKFIDITVKANANFSGTINNKFLMEYDNFPAGVPSNEVNVNVKNIGAPVIAKTVTPENGLTYERGESVTYTIKVNKALNTDDLQSVLVTDQLPNSLTYVPGTLKVDGTTVSDGNITPGGLLSLDLGNVSSTEKIITFEMVIKDTVPVNTTVSNTAKAEDNQSNLFNTSSASFVLGNIIINLAKTVDPSTPPTVNGRYYKYDDEILYKIKVTNSGSLNSSNLVLKDVIRPEFTYLSTGYSDPTGVTRFYDGTTKTVTFNIGEVNPGADIYLDVKVKVLTKESINNIQNSVTGYFENGIDPNPISVINNDVSTRGNGVLNIQKTVDPKDPLNPFVVGEEVTYTIDVTNTDLNGVISSVNLKDVVPSDLTYVANSLTYDGTSVSDGVDGDKGDITSGTITFNIGDMNPEETHKIKFKCKIKDTLSNGTIIENTAVGTATNYDDTNVTKNSSVEFVVKAPTVVVQKFLNENAPYGDSSGNPYYISGNEYTYRLVVENTGSSVISDYDLVDVLDGNTIFVSTSETAYILDSDQRTLHFNDLSLNPLETKEILITGKSTPNFSGYIDNSFSLSNINYPSGIVSNNVRILVKNVLPPVIQKSASADSDNNGLYDRGESVTYTVKLAPSPGSDTIDSLVFTDQLPQDMNYVPNSMKLNGNPLSDSIIDGNGLIKGTINNLTGENILTYEMTVKDDVPGGKVIANTAKVVNIKTGDIAADLAEIRVGTIDLELSKTLISTPTVRDTFFTYGDEIIYSIKVKNNGTMVAKNIELSDVLSPYYDYVAGGTYDSSTRTVKDVVLSLDPGEEYEMEIKVKVNTTDSVSNVINSVSIKFLDEYDQNPIPVQNNEVSIIGDGTLEITKKVDKLDETKPYIGGAELIYTINFANTDEQGDINDLVIEDIIPSGVTYVPNSLNYDGTNITDASDGDLGSVVGDTVTYNQGLMEHSQSHTLTFKVTIDDEIGDLVTITNEASGTVTNQDGTSTTEKGITAFISAAPVISVSKELLSGTTYYDEAGNPYFRSGDEFTYRLNAINTGSADFIGFKATDNLDPNLEFVSASINPTSITGGNTLNWENLDVLKGQTKYIDVTVKAKAEFSGEVTNTFDLIHSTIPDDLTSNEVKVEIKNIKAPLITKSVQDLNGGSFNRGDTITYKIAVDKENASDDLEKVTVTDQLPSELTYVPGTLKVDGVLISDSNINSTNTLNVELLNITNEQIITFDMVIKDTVGSRININNLAAAINNQTSDRRESTVGFTTGSLGLESKKYVSNKKDVYGKGEEVTYKIEVKNTGDMLQKNVIVKDTLPSQLTYVREISSFGGTAGINEVTFVIPEIKSGETKIIEFACVVTNNYVGQSTVVNTAKISGDTIYNVISDSIVISVKKQDDNSNVVIPKTGSYLIYLFSLFIMVGLILSKKRKEENK